jgi:hypothetical protein
LPFTLSTLLLDARPPQKSFASGSVYKDVIHFHTSAGTQLQGHEVEQVLGAVAHEW